MNTHSLAPLIVEAERILSAAVKHFKLQADASRIVVTIQSAGRKQALGWFGANHWQNGQPEPLHEINLSAEHLKTCDVGELLIHELAHAENKQRGIKDCAGRRHNRKFKTMAEELGLIVADADKSVGYGYTTLGEPAKAFLKKAAFKHKIFALSRAQFGTRKAPGSRLVKMVCPCCGYTVRTTRVWLEIGAPLCPDGQQMEEA